MMGCLAFRLGGWNMIVASNTRTIITLHRITVLKIQTALCIPILLPNKQIPGGVSNHSHPLKLIIIHFILACFFLFWRISPSRFRMRNRIMASLFLPFLLSKTTTRLGYVLLLISLSEIIFSNNHNVDYLFLRIVLNNG